MSVQPDYFTLFSLPRSFDVDAAALEKSYFALQRQYHPDRFAASSSLERARATQMAMQVNDAYQTLKLPLPRAKYLLQLQGVAVDNIRPDAATLVESMEMQEALAEVRTEAAAATLAKRVAAKEEECLAGLRAAFAGEDFPHAAQLALRLSYTSKLSESIRQKRFSLASAG